ncbi:MAG: glycoside hydrolase family 2 protein [Halobacteriaceae archaeon]
MVRTFDPSRTRRRRTLDGEWDFVTDPDGDGIDRGHPDGLPDDADSLVVPSPWNVDPAYHGYEGVGWYETGFEVTRAGPVRMVLHGVCHDATVWIDGDRVADHYGGYTPIEVIASLDRGRHSVVVRADSSRDDTSIPKPGTDWFPYGGITREVVVEEVPKTRVAGLDVTYDLDGDEAALTAAVTVANDGPTREETVAAELAGDRVSETVTLPADGETTVALDHTLAVERWTLDDPTLYTVTATVGDDERRERVGFRTVSVTDSDVLVNGDAVPLRGVNRHEDHPEWGHAQPERIQARDLSLIESMGGNFVRTSHYPNHPRLLDLCDERGLLVMEELPYWQFSGARFSRDPVLARGKTMLREMIARDRTHPAIVAWGLTNECAGHEDAVYDAVGDLAGIARDLDDRPVTLASMNYQPDKRAHDPTFEHCDIVCLNGYQGWYTEGDWDEILDPAREDYPEKPIVVSEFGAGAVYGERTWENQKWSEGHQAAAVLDAVEAFEAAPDVAGFAVWQFCDTWTTTERFAGRPKGKNNKGLVDEYRRPKEAYQRLRAFLTD